MKVRDTIDYLKQNGFIKNSLSLITGTALAQVIGFICYPVLTRLFSPEEFGTFTVFVSFTSFFSVISMFRYEAAIVLPKSDLEAAKLVRLCLKILLCISVSVLVAILLFRNGIINLFFDGIYTRWIYVIPFFLFIQGMRMVLNEWNVRKTQFPVISIGNIVRTTANNGISMLLGKFRLFPGGLIAGTVLGQMVEMVYLFFYNHKLFSVILGKDLFKRDRPLFEKYINFLKINTPHVLVDSLRNYLSPIVISVFFSKEILGYYSLMFSVIMMPVSLVGSSISQVFYQKLSYNYSHDQEIFPLVRRMLYTFLVLGIIPSAILMLFGQPLFSFVFGSEWALSGKYSSCLSLYMYAYFVSSFISYIPYVVNKMNIAFIYSVLINTSFFLIIIAGSLLKLDFLEILSCLNIIVSLLFMVYIGHFVRITRNIDQLKKNIQP